MNLKTMLAALQGITAYKDLLTQPVMERALRLVACAAHGDGLGGLEAYTDLFYQLRVEGYPGLGQWLGDALRWSGGPYPRLAGGGGRGGGVAAPYPARQPAGASRPAGAAAGQRLPGGAHRTAPVAERGALLL